MPWRPDVPDFPGKKPHLLEKLEKLSPEIINAMTTQEVRGHVEDAATNLAKGYHAHCVSNKDYGYEECLLFVAGALSQLGSSVGGQLGLALVGQKQASASEACKQFFSDNELET